MKKITPESVIYVSRLTASGGSDANNLCQATLNARVNVVWSLDNKLSLRQMHGIEQIESI